MENSGSTLWHNSEFFPAQSPYLLESKTYHHLSDVDDLLDQDHDAVIEVDELTTTEIKQPCLIELEHFGSRFWEPIFAELNL